MQKLSQAPKASSSDFQSGSVVLVGSDGQKFVQVTKDAIAIAPAQPQIKATTLTGGETITAYTADGKPIAIPVSVLVNAIASSPKPTLSNYMPSAAADDSITLGLQNFPANQAFKWTFTTPEGKPINANFITDAATNAAGAWTNPPTLKIKSQLGWASGQRYAVKVWLDPLSDYNDLTKGYLSAPLTVGE